MSEGGYVKAIAGLEGSEIGILLTDEQSLKGTLLKAGHDHLLVQFDQDPIYFTLPAIRAISKNSKKWQTFSAKIPFNLHDQLIDVLLGLQYQWVTINGFGKRPLGGVLSEIVQTHVTLISFDELLYVPVTSIETIQKGIVRQSKLENVQVVDQSDKDQEPQVLESEVKNEVEAIEHIEKEALLDSSSISALSEMTLVEDVQENAVPDRIQEEQTDELPKVVHEEQQMELPVVLLEGQQLELSNAIEEQTLESANGIEEKQTFELPYEFQEEQPLDLVPEEQPLPAEEVETIANDGVYPAQQMRLKVTEFRVPITKEDLKALLPVNETDADLLEMVQLPERTDELLFDEDLTAEVDPNSWDERFSYSSDEILNDEFEFKLEEEEERYAEPCIDCLEGYRLEVQQADLSNQRSTAVIEMSPEERDAMLEKQYYALMRHAAKNSSSNFVEYASPATGYDHSMEYGLTEHKGAMSVGTQYTALLKHAAKMHRNIIHK